MSKVPDEGAQLRSQGDRFDEALLEAVDESLVALLGEIGAATMYFHIKRMSSLEKSEMPRRLREFSLAIADIFKESAPAVEKPILRKLCEKLGLDYESVKDLRFQAALETARQIAGPTR
jgi:hypothetical protein